MKKDFSWLGHLKINKNLVYLLLILVSLETGMEIYMWTYMARVVLMVKPYKTRKVYKIA